MKNCGGLFIYIYICKKKGRNNTKAFMRLSDKHSVLGIMSESWLRCGVRSGRVGMLPEYAHKEHFGQTSYVVPKSTLTGFPLLTLRIGL